MKDSGTFVIGAATLTAIVVAHALWRWRLQELPETIERGDFEAADVLAGELVIGGQFGREVRILTGLLALCLVAMLVTSRSETTAATVTNILPEGLGYGSYL